MWNKRIYSLRQKIKEVQFVQKLHKLCQHCWHKLVGVILCASKDEQVVEYAISRTMSPTMVSQYTLKLIDKKLLENKLKEIKDIVEENNKNEWYNTGGYIL